MSNPFDNRLSALAFAREYLMSPRNPTPSLDEIILTASKIDAFVSGKTPIKEIIFTGGAGNTNKEYQFNYEDFIRYAKEKFIPSGSGPKEFQEQSWMKSVYSSFLGERYLLTGRGVLEYSLPRQIGVTTFLTILFDWLVKFNHKVLLVNNKFNTNTTRGMRYDVILVDSLRYHRNFEEAWASLMPCSQKILLINTVEGFGFGK